MIDGDEQFAEGPESVTDRRASEGLAHLQAAARELIKAARAVLDVAEELVEDPATVGSVAEVVGAVVQNAAAVGRRAVGHIAGDDEAGDDEAGDDEASDGAGDQARSGVERIRIG